MRKDVGNFDEIKQRLVRLVGKQVPLVIFCMGPAASNWRLITQR